MKGVNMTSIIRYTP